MSETADVLAQVLDVAERANYEGWSKHDALNAPWLNAIAGHTRLTRLVAIQSVMRFPLHIRPLLGVGRARNAKGLSLLARAYLSRYAVHGAERDLAAATGLLDWLIANPAPGFDAPCWGYPYPWQDVGFFAPRHFPNRVVTSFVTNALLDAWEVTGEDRFGEAAAGAVSFLLAEPKTLFEDEDHRCVSYVPSEAINWIVMDVSVLVGAVTARLAARTGDADLRREADRLVRYVVSRQTDYAAWFYSDPPGDSHIQHDNYHTGFILDAILAHHLATGSDEFMDAYRRGLDYYEEALFEADGAPRFMNNQQYPYDIHGAAQGIITFSLSSRHLGHGAEMATKVRDWTIREMFDPKTGWFAYQKRRYFTTNIRLLRWCQGWMALALAQYMECVEARS